jgi:hypothetical protein
MATFFILFVSFLFAMPTQAQTPKIPLPLSLEQVKSLEDGLATNPNDLAAHEKLIEYYFTAGVASRSTEFEDKRERHVF